MKKFVLLMILAIIAGLNLNCNPPVPQNSFRMKTRIKFHLFGFPLPFSIPNPNIAINLKTTTPPGAPGTTGTVSEFAPGGAFVPTNGSGYFDAVNAVVPAPYNAKVAPGQSTCSAPTSSVFPFYAVNGGTYKLNCRANITVTFLIEPSFVDLTSPGSGGNSISGHIGKSSNEEARFRNAQDLKIRYYRQVDGEDYELDGEKSPNWVSPDGTELEIPVPNYFSNHGSVHYRILIVDDRGELELYVGHGELDVLYPLMEPTPTPDPCPPLMQCYPQY